MPFIHVTFVETVKNKRIHSKAVPSWDAEKCRIGLLTVSLAGSRCASRYVKATLASRSLQRRLDMNIFKSQADACRRAIQFQQLGIHYGVCRINEGVTLWVCVTERQAEPRKFETALVNCPPPLITLLLSPLRKAANEKWPLFAPWKPRKLKLLACVAQKMVHRNRMIGKNGGGLASRLPFATTGIGQGGAVELELCVPANQLRQASPFNGGSGSCLNLG